MMETIQKAPIEYLSFEEIKNIVDGKIDVSTTIDRDGTFVITLSYGNKELEYKIFETNDPSVINTGTWIENIDQNGEIKGQTTLLYSQVKKLCQTLANRNKKVKYTLTTIMPSMQYWADNMGDDLFDWDEAQRKVVENGLATVNTYIKFFYKE